RHPGLSNEAALRLPHGLEPTLLRVAHEIHRLAHGVLVLQVQPHTTGALVHRTTGDGGLADRAHGLETPFGSKGWGSMSSRRCHSRGATSAASAATLCWSTRVSRRSATTSSPATMTSRTSPAESPKNQCPGNDSASTCPGAS